MVTATAPVSVDFDRRQLAEMRRLLADIPRGVQRAMSRAIRDTTRKGRVIVVKGIGSELALKQGDIYKPGARNRPVVERLDRKGPDVIGSAIAVTGRRLPLGRFQAKQHWRRSRQRRRRSYVSYRISKTAGRRKIDDAFAESMKSGHFGVFRRRGRARLPIQELLGPSVPQVALNLAAVQDLVRQRYGVILGEEAARAVAGVLARGGRLA